MPAPEDPQAAFGRIRGRGDVDDVFQRGAPDERGGRRGVRPVIFDTSVYHPYRRGEAYRALIDHSVGRRPAARSRRRNSLGVNTCKP